MISEAKLLVSAEVSRALDSEAQTEWGFNVFSLIEAAGRACARVLVNVLPDYFSGQPRITVVAGTGNNGADAMVMLRSWIISGLIESSSSTLLLKRFPKDGEAAPWVDLFRSLEKMKVPVVTWPDETSDEILENILAKSGIVLDGIAGTGLEGPLSEAAAEMVKAVNSCSHERSLVVSVDLPSGNFEKWEPGMPIITADYTLAIEPQKYCIYTPGARPHAGTILSVGGIFPQELISSHEWAELLDWDSVKGRLPKISKDAYKTKRGTVEIRAGSTGTTGAALVASRGAQAAGAGLIHLVADDEIYQILASQVGGIMVSPASLETSVFEGRFRPDALLLGSGWGKTLDRTQVLNKALTLEKQGIPLILDADVISLVRYTVFNGNAILTPHPGEFNKISGIEKKESMKNPAPILLEFARKRNAVILFKGHVITIAAPDGRLGVVDGMSPGLAAGGSGDLLAGFCAAIAARMIQDSNFDAYTCAAAAATLLIASGRSDVLKSRFTDPLEVADEAADLAGIAWLRGDGFHG